MPVSEATFRRLADEDHEGKWELLHGRLQSKPSGTFGHNEVVHQLLIQLWGQLNAEEWRVVTGLGWLSHGVDTFLIPDVAVVSREAQRRLFTEPDALEVYPVALPLVIEVAEADWLRYDCTEKAAVYRARGDQRVWLIDPWPQPSMQWKVTTWQLQADGSYTETVNTERSSPLAALPGVTIDLAELFDQH
jgi:Uma2 family endonuclease